MLCCGEAVPIHVSMWKANFGWSGLGLLRVCFCVVVRVCVCVFHYERLVLDGMLLAGVVTFCALR